MKHSLLRRWAAPLVAGLTLSLVAACGGTPSSDQGGGADVDQTLVVASQMASFPDLDTAKTTLSGYEGQRLVGNLIYEGLTKRDVSDPNKPAGVAGALAESWETAPDGLSYTFKLRPEVTFHDGTPWDADAALYNLNRYLDKNDKNYDAALVTWYDVLDYVKKVEKVDDMTIKFTLKSPFAYFLADLYNVYFGSPKVLEDGGGAAMSKTPTGTGPFKFEAQPSATEMSFVANKEWWGDGPKLDQMVVQLIPDPAARTAALRAGRVDWIEAAQPDDLASLEAAGFQAAGKKFDWEWSWQLFVDQPPFNDVRVRKAMNFAIDREAIARDLLHDTAVPAYQLLAEASLFYDAKYNIYNYDPDKAKALLAEAGYPNGFDITVGYITAGSGAMQPKAMNEAIQAQLAKVGIKVTYDPMDFGAFYSAQDGGKTGWQAANGAMSLEQPSSWDWVFKCGANYYGYCNKTVDQLRQKALITIDDEARGKLLTEATGTLTEDAVWMFVVNDTAPRAMAGKVKGYEQPMSWWVPFNQVYIAE